MTQRASARQNRRMRLATCVVVCLLLAGCGGGEQSDAREDDASPTPSSPSPSASPSVPEAPSATDAAPPPAKQGTRIIVDDSPFGPMLYDATGQAIYLFDVETTAEPRCYDACAEAWPPVFTEGDPVAGKGTKQSLLGTTKRKDGRLQVTYNDHPLYFYVNEGKYEVLCHDIFLNGGKWYVVQPDGNRAP